MCGLAGLLSESTGNSLASLEGSCRRMTDTLVHRGPDSSGIWIDEHAGLALGHRRLAIVDLSLEGNQPMISPSGRYVITFNGEIYNFMEMRGEIASPVSLSTFSVGDKDGYVWRGRSDTEVMLAAIECWGLYRALQRFSGMFAFALWDRQAQTLHLARDRLGEKPLYYGWMDGVFLFGSELKALRAHPKWKGEINRDALALYLRHGYVPGPFSIYQGIFKLVPGSVLSLPRGTPAGALPAPHSFWSAKAIVENSLVQPFAGTEANAVSELEHLLRASIRSQMVADVPLGAFLSGGLDSSTVVALMQVESNRPVKTFTIGFHESGYNEAGYAKAVARHLKTEHTELYVTAKEARAVIPRLPVLYDEPFADSSQIPTYLVAQLARHDVKVSLSGDGGDELFGGYGRYFVGASVWGKLRRAPLRVRRMIATALRSISPTTWDSVFCRIGVLAPASIRYSNPGQKLHKLADVLTAGSPEQSYLELVSHWKNPGAVVIGAKEPAQPRVGPGQCATSCDLSQCLMYLDTISYLPDDILTKVDRAAMSVSLETRTPFLDHSVVEFAWHLPQAMKIRDGSGKWILRQVLYRHVPSELIERPKAGFSIPIDDWLRGPLRNWAETLISEDRLKREGFFNSAVIREKWLQHLSGRRNWQYHLWNVLMFQAWLEAQS